ncbi:hypothetical protein SQ03_17765 [Methylobacterium platani JCM 14648]|nr:hypothetical protein SQ03_17765 [Methylobacterium platani JCM 14648]
MTVAVPPPSGVSGLTPTQVRSQLLRMGWPCVLPIVAHDNTKHNGRGKAPGIRRWGERALFEGPGTSTADLADWEKCERKWPGTGMACGDIVTIDADFIVEPDMADRAQALAFEVFGETPFIRQGQAPKVALVYRAAEAIPSVHLKTADGSGDGIDVLSTGTQFVAYGVHAKTLRPYSWIGAETPLTAGPDAAPEINQAQVDDFLARLGRVVELNGTGGRTGRGKSGGTGGGQIVRDETGRVVDGREFHLTRTVYAVALAMQDEGAEITVASLAGRAWEAFTASTLLDDARWSPEAARVKAAALLDRVRRGFVTLAPQPAAQMPAAAPSYLDHRKTVAEAEAETRGVVDAFFGQHVPAWKADREAWEVSAEEAKERDQEAPAEPSPVSWAARVETAIGKTALAIAGAAQAAKGGQRIVYAAPMHSLLAELQERFAAQGVEARVYRGYTSADPDAEDAAMCLDLPAMQDARDAGGSIRAAVCERRVDGLQYLCPFHALCGMQRQRQAKPQVWLIPHALLFQSRPSFIPKPDALVIDEGFTMGALPDKPARMSLDAIEQAPFERDDDGSVFSNAANDLQSARGALLRALRAHDEDGPLSREILLQRGVTKTVAANAYRLEWMRQREPGITPGMPPKARKAAAAAVAAHNKEMRLLAGLWAELRTFLEGSAAASGRLYLRYDREAECRVIERRSLGMVRTSWSAPALLLDATLPEPALLAPVLGHPVEVRADITARWSPYVRTRQIVGAPVTARKLGIIEGKEFDMPRRSVVDLMRLIRLRAALAFPRIVVVIAPQALVAKLSEIGLPENVETAHFGAVAGIDRWATGGGLICIGRLQPGPRIVEPLAGIITGEVTEALPEGEAGSAWYPRTEGGIRLASGATVKVEHERHPDSVAEALRWQITEAGLIQAIGRLRALRRGPDAPAFVDIINDVPLPLSVDAVVSWDEAKVGAWAEMAPEGVLLESPADIMACFPEVAPTRQAAREALPPTMVVTSIRDITIDVTTIVTAGQNTPGTEVSGTPKHVGAIVRQATYKRRGRYAPAKAILLPNAPADFEGWLFDRLGALEWVRIEEPEQAPQAEPAEASSPPAPASALPLRAADYDPELVTRFRCVVDVPAAERPAPVRAEVVRWTLPPDAKPIRWAPSIWAILATAAPIRLEAAE